jgi:hypothetical protein
MKSDPAMARRDGFKFPSGVSKRIWYFLQHLLHPHRRPVHPSN